MYKAPFKRNNKHIKKNQSAPRRRPPPAHTSTCHLQHARQHLPFTYLLARSKALLQTKNRQVLRVRVASPLTPPHTERTEHDSRFHERALQLGRSVPGELLLAPSVKPPLPAMLIAAQLRSVLTVTALSRPPLPSPAHLLVCLLFCI